MRIIIDEGYEYLLAEPEQPQNMTQILHACGSRNVSPVPIRAPSARSIRGSEDIFSRLPPELLYMIIELLPSYNIGRLRLASKSTAYVTHPTSLPQRFWRSQFRPDFEMSFAMPKEGARYEDWRNAYVTIRHALSNPLGSPYLKNRHRMWCIVSIVLPVEEGYVRRICVSTNSFNSQKFIAGFHFQAFDSPTRSCVDYSLGYISQGPEVKVEIPPAHRIGGFELAICANGVVGVRLVLREGSCISWSSWVGDIGDGGPNVAFATLSSLADGMQKFLLVVGFDAFEMVGLAILGESSARLEDVPMQPLWTPCCPRGPLTPAMKYFPRGSFNALLNMDFGIHGQNLAHLTRIVAHIQEYSAPFISLTFYFDNQSKMHFGRRGRMEISSSGQIAVWRGDLQPWMELRKFYSPEALRGALAVLESFLVYG
ncbi:hypothetical protein BDV26DRAFT_295046 [Aspergillus bertholletiae]|uniref:F-box domain-containing protein n=1 Tax=Aspergillus bertholletiae TaxID=1226010 RepID=A0A5N7B025_9EURO|nr:hypothetical protein BDV26DRAFT_295046 [Aspergillus bertholletiae]